MPNPNKRSRLEWILLQRAKVSYPYPLNPFCSSNVSVQLVQKVLDEAGYKDFTLHVNPDGIYIRPKAGN